MGFMKFTYRVEHKEGKLLVEWVPVLINVSLEDAHAYVKNKTSGLFDERASNYRIVKEQPKPKPSLPPVASLSRRNVRQQSHVFRRNRSG